MQSYTKTEGDAKTVMALCTVGLGGSAHEPRAERQGRGGQWQLVWLHR